MWTARRAIRGEHRPHVPLRSSFAWTFAGNAVHAGSQWAILSLIAKLGSGEMLGRYAYAYALALPVAMLSHLNLRAVLATDVTGHHTFADYVGARLWTTAGCLAATAAIAAIAARTPELVLLTIVAGMVLSTENLSDIYYGTMQRRERMDQVARSMILRAVVSVAAVAFTLALTRSLMAAMFGLLFGRVVMLLLYDRPLGTRSEQLQSSGVRSQFEILRTALPLGVVLMLSSLTANIPRYVIEHRFGTRELGAYAAVASFLAVGSTVVNALGQAATARLARCFGMRDFRSFRVLAWKVAAIAVVLGVCGVAVAAAIGPWVLRLLYRPEYAVYSPLLVALMAVGIVTYLAIALGYVLTSTRSFTPQTPLLGIVAATSGAGSWVLVPVMGLMGAAVAQACAAAVQIIGQLLLLRHAIRSKETA